MKHRLTYIAIFFLFLVPLSGQASSNTTAENMAEKVLNEGVNALEPIDIFVWVDFPKVVKINSIVYLKVEVKNLREHGVFNVNSIDLGSSLGKGFRVKKITPKPTNMDTALGDLSAEYNFSVASGESKHVIFELIAVNAGIYKGDVDVWEGNNVLTRVAQCRIEK